MVRRLLTIVLKKRWFPYGRFYYWATNCFKWCKPDWRRLVILHLALEFLDLWLIEFIWSGLVNFTYELSLTVVLPLKIKQRILTAHNIWGRFCDVLKSFSTAAWYGRVGLGNWWILIGLMMLHVLHSHLIDILPFSQLLSSDCPDVNATHFLRATSRSWSRSSPHHLKSCWVFRQHPTAPGLLICKLRRLEPVWFLEHGSWGLI